METERDPRREAMERVCRAVAEELPATILEEDAAHWFPQTRAALADLAALDTPHFTPPQERAAPLGWKIIDVRTPRFDEYFVTDTGKIGYQDGHVSFAGRNSIHPIILKDSELDEEKEARDGD